MPLMAFGTGVSFAMPNSISDLTALASSSIQGQVQLTWTVPDTVDSSPTPSGYIVKYATAEIDAVDFYSTWVNTYNYNWTVFAASGTAQSITLIGLTPGVTFYFAVVAIDTSGVNGVWNSASDTGGVFNTLDYAVSYDTAPAQVTGVNLSYGNTFINVSWQQNTEIDLKDYRVESSSYSNTLGFTEIAQVTKPGTTYQNTNLINGNTYYYRVRAEDNAGNLGIYSVVQSTRPWINLPVPSLNATYSQPISTTAINWAWNSLPAGTSGYNIINSTSGVILYQAMTPSDTYWAQNYLTPNSSNTLTLQIFNGYVTSNSPALTLHTYAIPPVNFSTSTLSSRTATLSWSNGANAPDTSYQIKRSSTNWNDWITINTAAGATSYSDTGLLEGATFSYSIWGINGEGNIQLANFSTITFATLRIPPDSRSLTPIVSQGLTMAR